MAVIDTGWQPYSKLKRQQLLELAYILEEQRDRAIAKAANARTEALTEAEQAIRRESQLEHSDIRRGALALAARIVADLREGRAT
jgi:hypothetical protein